MAANGTADERQAFTEYWTTDHAAPTLENMMLDSDASKMDVLERPEILSELPALTGKHVLELGAGIGRFSGLLAEKCERLVAVDFVEASCDENRRVHAHLENLEVVCADATKIDYEPGTFDLVFTNWLLMYLADEEVQAFASNALRWLKPGGHLFFRESCFHQSGNAKRRFNPTKYRHPDDYSKMFGDATLDDGSRFQLCATNCVEAYAQMKGNVHQMWFRWEKVDAKVSERQAMSLSTQQYSLPATMRYESLYGKNYITTGGDEIAETMLREVGGELSPGSRAIDIGCGLGGMLLYLSKKCEGSYLHGVSFNSGLHAVVGGRHVDREKSLRDRVSFSVVTECGVPASELSFPPNSFDAAFMREALMYVDMSDKPVLLRKLSRLLRPGAKFVITDYCLGRKLEACGQAFQDYVKERRYSLIDAETQRGLLERYFKVKAVNVTDQFTKFLGVEMERAREAFGPRQTLSAPTEEDEEKLARRVADVVHSEFPGLPAVAAASAAKSAMESVRLHLETEKVEQARRAEDLGWAEKFWGIKQKAIESGDLQWFMFVATKE
eukprot:CAMPEP_0204253818 /NCGR_PEP_ID=MMETSP0468-20130131/2119_1 /ASSEMBLY_ACC=CAM_ASM_000383 /TAXON_ID=2969 /ORGANISM="Oxyrrhis marina" /LENGTH=554 /DNA_ID=CAMNT_0051227449 /DNA_START=45 /DNA_END=1709 /DNA_ORIENTATION=-